MVQEIITYIIVAVAVVVSIRFIFGLGRKKKSCACGCGGKSTAVGQSRDEIVPNGSNSDCPCGCQHSGQQSPESDLCRGCTLQGVCHSSVKKNKNNWGG